MKRFREELGELRLAVPAIIAAIAVLSRPSEAGWFDRIVTALIVGVVLQASATFAMMVSCSIQGRVAEPDTGPVDTRAERVRFRSTFRAGVLLAVCAFVLSTSPGAVERERLRRCVHDEKWRLTHDGIDQRRTPEELVDQCLEGPDDDGGDDFPWVPF